MFPPPSIPPTKSTPGIGFWIGVIRFACTRIIGWIELENARSLVKTKLLPRLADEMVTGNPGVSPGKQPVVVAQVWLISYRPSLAETLPG